VTAKLDYRWHLREVMAARGMFSTTELRPLLAERGINLSPSQIYRLVVEAPERLSLKTLIALLDILGCSSRSPPPARSAAARQPAGAAPTPASVICVPSGPAYCRSRPPCRSLFLVRCRGSCASQSR
jgi:Cro/C1-type HTH DNA-binding domain